MSRTDIIMSMFDPSGIGLEIGPSYNPIVPKSSGARIETVDHTDQAGLVKKYLNDPSVDVTRIEPVDHVSDGRSISQVIGRRKYYDYIIASHVIEHTTNLLGFLRDCHLLLKDTGVLVLAVPDRRYCFDFFRPSTSAGDVLQAFYENRTRHTPGTMFDHLAYVARRGEHIAWTPQHDGKLEFVHSLQEAAAYLATHRPDGEYVDCHAWQFTPASFRLIVHDLNAVGLLALREHAFHDTLAFEFFISLSAGGAGCPIDRLALAEVAQNEATATIATVPAVASAAEEPVKPSEAPLVPANVGSSRSHKSQPRLRRLKKAIKKIRCLIHA